MNNSTHNIAFIGFDRIQLLDLVGPLEAFLGANSFVNGKQYETFIIAEQSPFISESKIKIIADYTLDNALGDIPRIDTLVIPGGVGSRVQETAEPISKWIDRHFEQIERVVSVCTGMFFVANNPYLTNKSVVTHWAHSEFLQSEYPNLKVDHERLFIQQGKFYSAAGILSGIDLALNLIESDHGVDVAASVAKYLVTYLKRMGHQSQFSEPLKFQSNNNTHLERVNRWLNSHPTEMVTVAKLAEKAHLSERHLNRLIKQHYRMNAAKYIEHSKLEQAKIFLTKANTAIDAVADQVGFASSDAFRRSFKRKYGITPSSYQQRFC